MFPLTLPTARQMKVAHDRAVALAGTAVPWNECRWAPSVGVDAMSFEAEVVTPMRWEGVQASPMATAVGRLEPHECVDFGNWRYAVRILPPYRKLSVYKGPTEGYCVFNSPCPIPGIWQRCPSTGACLDTPIMSLTPNEVWTLRPGVRYAKGHTVIAGLGLGWALVQIARKRSVERITVVERDASVLEAVVPRLPQLDKPIEYVCGDARKLVPSMQADVAVCDIDSGYGHNTFPRCKNIGRVWVWGSAKTARGGWW